MSFWWELVKDFPKISGEVLVFGIPLWMMMVGSITLVSLFILILWIKEDLDPVMRTARYLFFFTAGSSSLAAILVYGFRNKMPDVVLTWCLFLFFTTAVALVLGFTPLLDRIETKLDHMTSMKREKRNKRKEWENANRHSASPAAVTLATHSSSSQSGRG